MGQPAARVGDMHVCPMVTPGVPPVPHVGGPILPPATPTVLIGKMPAATLGALCTCVGPPDSIVKGSMAVLIGKKPAARMGDLTAHGGSIVAGLPTVLIGDPIGVAIANASAMLAKKLEELDKWDEAAKANARKWMGDDSEATRQMLKDRITKELNLLKSMTADNFKPGQQADLPATMDISNVYAYVQPNDPTHTVYLGGKFNDSNTPDTGTDSRAGTLAHELSHFNDIGGTDDVVHPACGGQTCYGSQNAENLAKSSPADAQKNADNFEYYTEN